MEIEKQAIKILKDELELYLIKKPFYKRSLYFLVSGSMGKCLAFLDKKQYKILKEVLESE